MTKKLIGQIVTDIRYLFHMARHYILNINQNGRHIQPITGNRY